MKNVIILFLVIIGASSCTTYCNKDLRVGEVVQIPLNLENYPNNESQVLQVWKITDTDTAIHSLEQILWSRTLSDNPSITDNSPEEHYSSDLDGASLYFYEMYDTDSLILRDSMTNIVIRKSQEKVDDPCYADHPNVQIDELSYTHAEEKRDRNYTVLLGR